MSLLLSNCFFDISIGCNLIGICENGDSIFCVLWYVVEERWKDVIDMFFDYILDKIFYIVVEV